MFYFQYLQLLLDCDEGVSGLSWLQPGQRPPDPFQQLKKITSRKKLVRKHSILGVINWSNELSLSRCTNTLKIQLLMHWRCRKALGKLSSYPSILYNTYLRLKLGGQRPWSWHLRKNSWKFAVDFATYKVGEHAICTKFCCGQKILPRIAHDHRKLLTGYFDTWG